MPILPSQVEAPDVRIEAAFGVDPASDQAGWTWTDLSDRLLTQEIALRRGLADESTQAQPASVTFQLDNPDGALTPGQPTSQWYPHVNRGVPVRVSISGGPGHLALPGVAGAHAVTPDAAALDLTGVIELSFDIEPDDLTPNTGGGGFYAIASKGGPGAWSWLAYLTDSQLAFAWSTNGTTIGGVGGGAGTTVLPTFLDRRRSFLVRFNPNNGAGGRRVEFFAGPTRAGPWTQIGNGVTVAGTTALHNSSDGLYIGGQHAGSFAPFKGRIHGIQLRNGAGGPLVADVDFGPLDAGTTSFSDGVGRSWAVAGAAAVEDWSTRLVGQVADLTPTWPYGDLSHGDQPGEARVDVTVAGVLRRMAQGDKPLASTIRRLATASYNLTTPGARVIAYWPLEDGERSLQAAGALPGVQPMIVGGDWRFAADDSLDGSDAVAGVAANSPAGFNGIVPASVISSGSWAVEMFVRLPEPVATPASTPLIQVTTSGQPRTWTVLVNDIALIVGANYSDSTPAVLATGGVGGFFGGWTLLRFQVEQNGGNVDWAVQYVPLGGSGAVFGHSGSVAGTIGAPATVANLFTAPTEGVSFGHVIVTDGLQLGWLAPADTGYLGERAGRRIMRLCRQEGISLAFYGDPDDTPALGPQRVTTLLDLLGEAAGADMGFLHEQRRSLGLAYRTRSSLYNQAPALVLDAATNDIDKPFTPVLDDQRLRNDITVTRTDGSSVRLVDEDSVAAEGLYDEQVDVNVETDDQLTHLAGWRLALGTWPGMRYPELTSELTVAPHVVDAWLGLDVGDRVQVLNLPPQHPTDTVDLIVEGQGETWSKARHVGQLICSPGGPYDAGVLDADGTPDTTMKRLSSDGSELAAGVSATATSLSVAVIDGPLWTTDPDHFPLALLVGGERMTCTAISGASSPQAFTVARSANGVVKAHAAGAAVQVADPLRLTL